MYTVHCIVYTVHYHLGKLHLRVNKSKESNSAANRLIFEKVYLSVIIQTVKKQIHKEKPYATLVRN